jgi:hypothetical protein
MNVEFVVVAVDKEEERENTEMPVVDEDEN